MTSEQLRNLADIWTSPWPRSLHDFNQAINDKEVVLNTVAEALVFYSALAKLSANDQLLFHSGITEVKQSQTMLTLFKEWLKLSNKLGDEAVKQVNEMLLKKP